MAANMKSIEMPQDWKEGKASLKEFLNFNGIAVWVNETTKTRTAKEGREVGKLLVDLAKVLSSEDFGLFLVKLIDDRVKDDKMNVEGLPVFLEQMLKNMRKEFGTETFRGHSQFYANILDNVVEQIAQAEAEEEAAERRVQDLTNRTMLAARNLLPVLSQVSTARELGTEQLTLKGNQKPARKRVPVMLPKTVTLPEAGATTETAGLTVLLRALREDKLQLTPQPAEQKGKQTVDLDEMEVSTPNTMPPNSDGPSEAAGPHR